MAMDPKEWFEPEHFIPERFDENHPYYLTPSGKKRNPYSFAPFLGGQRICIGKTFVDQTSKLSVSTILTHFDLEALVDVDKIEAPDNNLTSTFNPTFNVKIKRRANTFVVSDK